MTKTIKFKSVEKDKLFYNKYHYCVRFNLDEASILKCLDHNYIDETLESRRIWRKEADIRWAHILKKNPHFSPMYRYRSYEPITTSTFNNLHTVTDFLLGETVSYKLITTNTQGWIYTNDLDFVKRIGQLKELKHKKYTKVDINRPTNSVVVKSSQYPQRSYLKSIKFREGAKETLAKFLNAHKDNIRLSPSLTAWLNKPLRRTLDHYFIDHTGEEWLLLLTLVQPGLIRKTVDIIKA